MALQPLPNSSSINSASPVASSNRSAAGGVSLISVTEAYVRDVVGQVSGRTAPQHERFERRTASTPRENTQGSSAPKPTVVMPGVEVGGPSAPYSPPVQLVGNLWETLFALAPTKEVAQAVRGIVIQQQQIAAAQRQAVGV